MHLTIVSLLLVGSAAENVIYGNMNTIMTARCRAQCLNRFLAPRTDCSDSFDCWSCWGLCDKLYRDVSGNSWRKVCDNESLCTTGCQESCRFYNSHSELIEATRTDTHFTQPLKYEVDERHNEVHFNWAVPEGNDRIEPLVYVLAASDTAFEEALGQTSSTSLTVPREFLRMFLHLRLTAYDSNGKVAEMESPLQDLKLEQWTPSLNSLKIHRFPVDDDVDAYISWPRFTDEDMTYEVQWRSSSPKLVTTGHLTTQENVAVLSLRPNILFQLKVTARRTESPNVIAQSETIFFFTNPHPSKEPWDIKCAGGCVKAKYVSLGITFAGIGALAMIWMIRTRKCCCSGDSECTLDRVAVEAEKSPSISKASSVWHVGSSPGYKVFQNDDSFTWTPPGLKKFPESVQI